MFGKKKKEKTPEEIELEKEAKKESAEKETIIVTKKDKQEEPTIDNKELIMNMTEAEYRTFIIEALSEILGRLRENENNGN